MKEDRTPENNPHISRMDELLNEPVLDHSYDGIEELDNPLPGWWLSSFYICIVVGIVYFAYHNILYPGDVHERNYNNEVAAYEQRQMKKRLSEKVVFTPEQLLVEMTKPASIQAGEILYNERCVACHAAKGAGQIGPNLTDDYWLNGDGKALSIRTLIHKGVTTKGMPAWEAVFSDKELIEITAYVVSLRGQTVDNPKAAQGEKKDR